MKDSPDHYICWLKTIPVSVLLTCRILALESLYSIFLLNICLLEQKKEEPYGL